MKSVALGFLVFLSSVTFGLSTGRMKSQLRGLDWNQLRQRLITQGQHLAGDFQERKDWKSWACDAHYWYLVQAEGNLTDIKLNLSEDGYLDVFADIRDAYFRADGLYKSGRTLRQEVGGWLGAGTPRIQNWARVYFGEDITKDLKVQILKTQLDTLDLGSFVPSDVAMFVTGLCNRTLDSVWGSWLGEQLSAAITEQLKKKMPDGLGALP